MKRIIAGLVLWVVLAGCGAFGPGVGQKDSPEVFTAAVWNVQALFDGRENGNEYAEYLEAAGWTAEKYAARLTAIGQAVPKMTGDGEKDEVPAIIGLVEIENEGVLDDLCRGPLSKYGYFWNAFASLPGSSLGIGFISRFPITEAKAHSITAESGTAPRPVLEVRVEPRGKPLVFLLCHWKSKLGDDNTTEALRRASARIVGRRLRELSGSETPVIVMGDLNENHDEFYRRGGSVFSALLPDDPDAAAVAANAGRFGNSGLSEFLVLSGEKPPAARFFPEEVPALYSPWMDEMGSASKGGAGSIGGEGSYYYQDDWETIDHVLLSDALFGGSGWEFAECRALKAEPFTTANGAPNAYVPRYGRGLSDHLPLLLKLRYAE